MTYQCGRCPWPGDSEPCQRCLTRHLAWHPRCAVCQRATLEPHETQTCGLCVGTTRDHLAETVELYALLPAQLGALPSASDWRRAGPRSTETPMPGGTPLGMLAGGSAGRSQVRGARMPDGSLATDHEADEWDDDPASVAHELARWEDDWRTIRSETAAPYLPTVVTSAGYLRTHLRWAATTHPDFAEFAGDLRRLRSRLLSVTGRGERPEKGAPCFGCRTPLERGYVPRQRSRSCVGHDGRCPWPHRGCCDTGGLAGNYKCPRCHRAYTDAEYWLAVRADIERQTG